MNISHRGHDVSPISWKLFLLCFSRFQSFSAQRDKQFQAFGVPQTTKSRRMPCDCLRNV